jgi:hypothetical protein
VSGHLAKTYHSVAGLPGRQFSRTILEGESLEQCMSSVGAVGRIINPKLNPTHNSNRETVIGMTRLFCDYVATQINCDLTPNVG